MSAIAVHVLTRGGLAPGARLATALGADLLVSERLAADAPACARSFALPMREALATSFHAYRGHVFVVAVGAVVRMVAPLLRGKTEDPAVVSVDEAGRFAVAVLAGHVGGANALAERAAAALGGTPVVTTASDVQGTIAVDLLGAELGWRMEDPAGHALAASAAMVNGAPVALVHEVGEPYPPDGSALPANVRVFRTTADPELAAFEGVLAVTDRLPGGDPVLERAVLYRPRSLAVGVGCDRGAPAELVLRGVEAVLAQQGLSAACVREIASVELKADEPALHAVAARLGCPIRFFPAAELDRVEGIENPSARVAALVGTRGVAEPAALLASGAEKLLVPKQVYAEPGIDRRMTVAVARVTHGDGEKPSASASPSASATSDRGSGIADRDPQAALAIPARARPAGSLTIVGLGPGSIDHMTPAAADAIRSATVVVGYARYLDLVRPLLAGKELISSGMTEEIARARAAVERARSGERVALVGSGDASVYGLASLAIELLRETGWRRGESPEVAVVPGVTALLACASRVGAPLGHDFCAVSLSDLLTPWEVIGRRLEAVAAADFVVGLYNPASARRRRPLEQAVEILRRHRSGATPVAVVVSAFRDGEDVKVTDLDHLLEAEVGMDATVIVGSSRTSVVEGLLVTPRGYGDKYAWDGAPREGRRRGRSFHNSEEER